MHGFPRQPVLTRFPPRFLPLLLGCARSPTRLLAGVGVTSHDNLDGILMISWSISELQDLGDGESCVLGGDDGGLLGGSGHEGAAGDVVGAT